MAAPRLTGSRSKGTAVQDIYISIKIKQVYGGRPAEPPKPQTIECPRCHAPNHPSQLYCSKCGAPLYGCQQSTVIEGLKDELKELKELVSSFKGGKA